jgi:hypothetical protein
MDTNDKAKELLAHLMSEQSQYRDLSEATPGNSHEGTRAIFAARFNGITDAITALRRIFEISEPMTPDDEKIESLLSASLHLYRAWCLLQAIGSDKQNDAYDLMRDVGSDIKALKEQEKK